MSLEDLEARVSAIEERLGMEAGLRASQDRDLATMGQRVHATNLLVQALSITQAEHTATLAEHTATLAEHSATLAEHSATLAEHTATLAEHTGLLASAHDKLDRLLALLSRLINGERP